MASGAAHSGLQIASRRSPPRTLGNFRSWRSKNVRKQNQKLTGPHLSGPFASPDELGGDRH